MKKAKMIKNKYIILISGVFMTLLLAFFSYDIYKIVNHIMSDNSNLAIVYLEEMDLKIAFLFGGIQFLQILFGLFPSEFVQVFSILLFGPLVGVFLCYVASLIGACTIYFIVKYSKTKYFETRHKKIIGVLDLKTASKKKIFFKILSMHLFPLVSIGSISYYFASKKVNFIKYFFISAIALIPSILISVLLSYLIMWVNSISLSLTIILISSLLVIFLLKNYFDELFYCYHNNIVKKPNQFLFRLTRCVLTKFYNKKNNVVYNLEDIKDLKPPFIVLCNHPSNLDFIYASYALKPYVFSTVVAKKYFYIKKMRFLLVALGCIPNNLFNKDINTFKSISRCIDNNRVVLMMPEGRVSTLGRREKIIASTNNLIKKLNIDVVTIKIEGAYYTTGKFFKNHRLGTINVVASKCLAKKDLPEMSLEAISKKINDSLYYDDSVYVAKNKNLFFETNDVSRDLDNILFICPNCKSRFSLSTFHNFIKCNKCEYNALVNKRYEIFSLEDENINIDTLPKFYDFQYDEIKKQVAKKSFYYSEKVSITIPFGQKNYLKEVGEGIASIDRNNFIFTGKIDFVETKIVIPVLELKTIIFGEKNDFQIYHEQDFYAFKSLENKKSGIKWSFISEVLNDFKIEDEFNKKEKI